MKAFPLLFVCLITTLFADDCCETEYCLPPTQEAQCSLLNHLNAETRRLYNSLDCKGKNRAIELSSQLEDKNRAVQQAAKEMAKRQLDEYPNQHTYEYRLRQGPFQEAYDERFGY